MRSGAAAGVRPFAMTKLKTKSGLAEVIEFIETRGLLVERPKP